MKSLAVAEGEKEEGNEYKDVEKNCVLQDLVDHGKSSAFTLHKVRSHWRV